MMPIFVVYNGDQVDANRAYMSYLTLEDAQRMLIEYGRLVQQIGGTQVRTARPELEVLHGEFGRRRRWRGIITGNPEAIFAWKVAPRGWSRRTDALSRLLVWGRHDSVISSSISPTAE